MIGQRTGERCAQGHSEAQRSHGEACLPQWDVAHLMEVDEHEPEQGRRADHVDDGRQQEPLQRGAEGTEPHLGHEQPG